MNLYIDTSSTEICIFLRLIMFLRVVDEDSVRNILQVTKIELGLLWTGSLFPIEILSDTRQTRTGWCAFPLV